MTSNKDGAFSFNLKLPSEGLALRSVSIQDGIPRLTFDPALKVPTLTEEDIGIACRLACEETRPEFFYYAFPITHPYRGRQYMHHSPAWLRGTSVGELLAEADWTMKCLNVGARSDKKKERFWAWEEKSNLEGLANVLDFPEDKPPGSVIMSCESVEVEKSENEMAFTGEPKMKITTESNSTYTKYISEILPSIAYHDEPLFLKVQELVKLILAAEWLKEKKVRFSRPWMMECSAAKSQEASQAVEVRPQSAKENKDAIAKFEKSLPEATHKESTTVLGIAKLDISVDKTESGIEANINQSFQSAFPPVKMEATTTVRASVHDHDMVYKGLDPNMPIVLGISKAIIPKVQSWSELFSQTVPWPRVWLLPFEGVELVTTSGGVSTSSIPVVETATTRTKSEVKVQVPVREPVRQEQYEACNGQLHVLAQQGGGERKKRQKRVPNGMVPRQTTVTPPKNDVISETDQTLMHRSLKQRGAKRGYGYFDTRSGEHVVYNEKGELIKRAPGMRQRTHVQGTMSVGDHPNLAPLPPTQQQVAQPVGAATNDLLSPASSVSSLDSGISTLAQSRQDTDEESGVPDADSESGNSSDTTVDGEMDQD